MTEIKKAKEDRKSLLPVGTKIKLSDGKIAKVLTHINAPDERYALEIDGEECPALLLIKSTCKIIK